MFRMTTEEPSHAGAGARPPGEGTGSMLVAQITDVHLGFAPNTPDEPNRRRLDALIAHLAALDRAPDLLLVTGDLTDRGDVGSYRALRDVLDTVGVPVRLCVGNHDSRQAFRSVFPEVGTDANGFVQYVVETPALRIVVLDTLEEGRHGGAFCDARADWLRARLDEAPHRPTLLVMHHPPFPCGIEWITTDPDEPWVARLRDAVRGARNIIGMVAGHVHRPIVTLWDGAPFVVCPSVAPPLALTLAPLDPDRPDGRPMIVDGPPGLALHWWTGRNLLSHFADTGAPRVLARFDGGTRAMVQGMMAERAGATLR